MGKPFVLALALAERMAPDQRGTKRRAACWVTRNPPTADMAIALHVMRFDFGNGAKRWGASARALALQMRRQARRTLIGVFDPAAATSFPVIWVMRP